MRNHGSTVQCKICRRECKSKKLLSDHMRVHGPKKHQCPRCDKSFVRRHNLESHMLHYHKEVLPKAVQTPKRNIESPDGSPCFKCDSCDLEYKYRESLFTHKKYIHGTKEHACNICGRLYSKRERMLNHMESHGSSRDSQEKSPAVNGSATFQCSRCPRQFHLKSRLQTHTLTVHVLNKHECPICELRFSSRRRLNWHSKTHHQPSESEASQVVSRKQTRSITQMSNGTMKPAGKAKRSHKTNAEPQTFLL